MQNTIPQVRVQKELKLIDCALSFNSSSLFNLLQYLIILQDEDCPPAQAEVLTLIKSNHTLMDLSLLVPIADVIYLMLNSECKKHFVTCAACDLHPYCPKY